MHVLWWGRAFHVHLSSKRTDSPVDWEIRVSQTASSPHPLRPLLCAHLFLPGGPQELATLIDFRANACIIGGEVTRQLGLSREPLPQSVSVQAFDGHHLGTSHTRPSPWSCSCLAIIMSRSNCTSWTRGSSGLR